MICEFSVENYYKIEFNRYYYYYYWERKIKTIYVITNSIYIYILLLC